MKNNFAYSVSPFLFLLFALSARGQSGFMRDVLNAVKGTAQNRANNTATQGTNKAIDQVDPATQSKSHSGSSGGSSASPTRHNSDSWRAGCFRESGRCQSQRHIGSRSDHEGTGNNGWRKTGFSTGFRKCHQSIYDGRGWIRITL